MVVNIDDIDMDMYISNTKWKNEKELRGDSVLY